MSDYLWDKTGEPEEDVEQLENLLGTLRYQPRPLDIPATAMPTAARPRTTMTTIFSRPRLAIAASLLLTLLAGTWFVTRQAEQQAAKLSKVEQATTTSGSGQTETAVVPNAATDSNASTGSAVSNASIDNAVESNPRQKKAVVVATPKTQRAPRQFVAKQHKLQPRKSIDNAPAPLEEVAVAGGMRWQVEQPMTAQQREATEQLMLALRLASAKFNYAQREMQEIGRAGK